MISLKEKKTISQLNLSNLALQLETSKQLEELNQTLPQNIRVTDYDLEQSLEDQQLRIQLESIKLTQSHVQFKSNMDEFKIKKDSSCINDTSEDIYSPESSGSSNETNSQKKQSNMESQNPFSQQTNQLRGHLRQQKYSLQNTTEDQFLAKSFQSSNTCKNFIVTQQANEINFLSPQVNNQNSLIRSSLKENTISSQTARSASKKLSTLLQLKNIQSFNTQPTKFFNQCQMLQPEAQTDDQKSKNLNVLEIINGKDKIPVKRNLLKQIYYIRRITNILKQRLDKKRILQLKQSHYNIINDKAYFFSPIQQPQNRFVTIKIIEVLTFILGIILNKIQVKQLLNTFLLEIYKIYIKIANLTLFISFLGSFLYNLLIKNLNQKTFSPDSFFIMLLNSIILIIQFIQLVVYPLKSAFYIQELWINQVYQNCFHWIPLTVGLLEILINFNISYYENGVLVKNRGLIFWKYFQNKLLFDIICILLVQFNYSNGFFGIDMLFAIFSLKKIIMNLKSINDHFQIEQRFATSYDLLKLSLLIFYMGHYSACGYFYIGKLYSPNWIIHYGFLNETWVYNYVNSLYFTFITMITVGFGDIAPINMYEKIYVIFMTVVSCGVFAYSVNTIGRIFSEIALREAKFKQYILTMIKI